MKKVLIGGQKLRQLGHNRHTIDTDYLINEPELPLFSHDEVANVDYINAAKSSFFKQIWEKEVIGGEVTIQGLYELKAYSWVQHILNGNYKKADDARHDMAFLLRNGANKVLKYANKHMTIGELNELMKEINDIRL